MSSPFQVAACVNSPSFPNSIVWSEDNFIAVATGEIVTILNPEQPHSPRGVITLTIGKPFPIGVIDKSELVSGCLLPICLSRDRQPCVRSLSWSPAGFAANNGCLLAVCSTEGRVKIYRQPYCEFQTEWIELMDLSDMLCNYFSKIFQESESLSLALVDGPGTQIGAENIGALANTNFPSTKEGKRKRDNEVNQESLWTKRVGSAVSDPPYGWKVMAETVTLQSSAIQEGSLVEVFKEDGGQHIWLAGRLQHLKGSKALVDFCDAEASNKRQWFEMNSRINSRNQSSHLGMGAADEEGCSFPGIRPSMEIARLPEQIVFAENDGDDGILKVAQVLEAWTADRWVEGVFVGFSDGNLLIRFNGDPIALNPSDVRVPPIWKAEEKLWLVTTVRAHLQESPGGGVGSRCKEKKMNSSQIVSSANGGRAFSRRTQCNGPKHCITARQYASRYSILASVVVSWSPLLEDSSTSPDSSSAFYTLLAVGTKSGNISVWRIHTPPNYSVECQVDPTVVLIGSFEAHNAWVTALSWGLISCDSSAQVLLASGCSDGSVKIWQACVHKLGKTSEADHIPFCLFTEVTVGDAAFVSALSLFLPALSPHKVLLAVGKGSGSLEVWTCNTKTRSPKKVGSYDAHVQVITGLAWAFDGRCLYSCSLDNSLHAWIYHKSSLFEVSIPSCYLGIRSISDLPSVSDSCYGLAISPGNLVLAVARRFDAEQLDPMYKKRTQRAAVEFFWIGGQQVNISSTINLDVDIDACPGFSKDELELWGSKLLWSLNRYECHNRHLVVWDVVAAFLAFKQCAPRFMNHILLKWLGLLFGHQFTPSMKSISSYMSKCMPKLPSRLLHLFNIFCRRVILCLGYNEVKFCTESPKLAKSDSFEDEQKWMELLLNSEKELRERLVSINLSTLLCRMSHPDTSKEFEFWCPAGSAQMLKWVSRTRDHLHDYLEFLASEVKGFPEGSHSDDEYDSTEQCSFCSETVGFESPETAFCKGHERDPSQRHKLARCAVSMQVCPLKPLWYCICCQRQAFELPPDELFRMPNYPHDFMSFIEPLVDNLIPKPLCPFCGISLQRLQPDFLLSTSPV